MTITFGSLFTGIGGIDLGLERAGMICKWQVEIDPYCQKVLQKHWPDVKRYADVREVGKQNLEPVDLIAGGFPCQPHSLAGKRKASADERDLWPQFYRIIRDLRPEWVLAENVPGLRSSEHGRFFGRVLRDLAASGYCVEWQSIPAAAFGAPHIRERIIIVAHNPSFGKRRLPVPARGSLEKSNDADRVCENVSDTNLARLQKPAQKQFREIQIKDAAIERCVFSRAITEGERGNWWSVEPNVGRVANGVPARVDRLRSLGNAVVPQVAEFVGKRIMEVSNEHNSEKH